MDKLRLGIIGIGHMGKYHLNIAANLKAIKFVGICDKNTTELNNLAKTYHCEAFTDYIDLLHLIDAVIIAVPTELHYPIAKAALEMGIHVLVEKPITDKVEDAEELVELALHKNRILHVGHVERFNGAVQQIKKIVNKPYFLEAKRVGPYGQRIQDVGVVLDLMIHDIDIIMGIESTNVTEINAAGRKVFSDYEDFATTQIIFESGTIAHFIASRVTQEKIRTLEITQEDAYIFLDYATQDIQIHRRPNFAYYVDVDELQYRQESLIERLFITKENPLKLEIEHFLQCIIKNADPSIENVRNIETLKITSRIRELILSNTKITQKVF